MSAQHTQGLLRVPDDGTVGSIETEDGDPIGHTFQVSTNDQLAGSPIRRANARRLVACWNYCEGLDTEGMEDSVKMGIPIKTFVDEAYAKELSSLAQREKLIVALKSILEVNKSTVGDGEAFKEIVAIASVAIAENGGA